MHIFTLKSLIPAIDGLKSADSAGTGQILIHIWAGCLYLKLNQPVCFSPCEIAASSAHYILMVGKPPAVRIQERSRRDPYMNTVWKLHDLWIALDKCCLEEIVR